MAKDPKSISLAYLDAVGSKEFDQLDDLLASDLEFKGPVTAISGAQGFIAAAKRIGTVLLRNDVKKVFVDGDEVCVIYDFVTDTRVGVVPTVEWLRITDGRIRSIWLLYDRQPWPAVMEEIARRSASQPPRA